MSIEGPFRGWYCRQIWHWWKTHYWRAGVGKCCLICLPHWHTEGKESRYFNGRTEQCVLDYHVRAHVALGFNPQGPEHILLCKRGKYGALVIRRDLRHSEPGDVRPWAVPSWDDERELMEREGVKYVTVRTYREAIENLKLYLKSRRDE